MYQKRRILSALCFLGPVTLGLILPGCGSGLGQVTVQELSSNNSDPIPHITVERLKGCLSQFGEQLEPRHHRFSPIVHVDQQGIKWGVTTDDIPKSADGFAACTRIVLNEMAIPHGILNLRPTGATVAANEATVGQRSYMGNPAVAVIVVIGLSEIVLEAGAYTILFAVTVKVVDKAKDDVVDALKRIPITDGEDNKDDCAEHFAACIATPVARQSGNHWKQTRCGICLAVCVSKKSWPSEVGNGSCEYRQRGWGL